MCRDVDLFTRPQVAYAQRRVGRCRLGRYRLGTLDIFKYQSEGPNRLVFTRCCGRIIPDSAGEIDGLTSSNVDDDAHPALDLEVGAVKVFRHERNKSLGLRIQVNRQGGTNFISQGLGRHRIVWLNG